MLTQYLYSYLIVDYDRSNFSVSQALFPDPSIEQNLVLIYPPGNDNTSLTSPTSSTSDNKSGHHLQIGVIVAIVAISVVVFAISLLGLFWRKLLEIWTIRPIPKDRLQFRVRLSADQKALMGQERDAVRTGHRHQERLAFPAHRSDRRRHS